LSGPIPSRRLKPSGSPELQRIAESVNSLADQRRSLQEDVEVRIREARLSVEEERNRLAALMSELNQSVVVCNLDGRILLYNSRARLQFKACPMRPRQRAAARSSASGVPSTWFSSAA
jgi:DNA polymerase-3 subunit epsilon